MKLLKRSFKPLLILIGGAILFSACGGASFDVDDYCEKAVKCCDDVDKKYCEIKGKDDVAYEQCKVELQAEIDQMMNNKPGVCDEWWNLQADYVNCIPAEDVDCDDWIGKEHWMRDNKPDVDDEVCRDVCEALIDYKEIHNIANCGSVVSIGSYKDDWYCTAPF